MKLDDSTRAVFESLIYPKHKDLMDMANVSEMGSDLALAHIELMREHGEEVTTGLLALEQMLTRVKRGF